VKPRVVVVDNYDSFTFNLVQQLETLGAECEVWLNDRTDPRAIADRRPHGILLSPGPGTPDDAGVTLAVIAALGAEIPILGVCLGHQSIAQAYGGRVIRAARLMHGKTSPILHDGSGLFAGIPSPFEATRYHSLLVDPSSLPPCFRVVARTAEGEIMGIVHQSHPVQGLQFHPESVLTEHGIDLVRNWLEAL
jgi:anthranilate synthase/aminodeoxychorismate synthase-like glutamine amidotransferase